MDGTVAAGFEAVAEVFEAGAGDLAPGGGAFCVFADGEPVVDLWAGSAGEGRPWERDTRAVLMSATKGMTALCAQILYDRGLLDLDAAVASYWPGFERNGKAAVTVRDVLTHASGVVGVPGHEHELRFDGSGWDDLDAIAGWLAEAPPAWEPGTKRGYHAMTFAWLVGELVRRIDGRTLGTFFHDEVAGPLGLDARIGTPADEQAAVATVVAQSREERAAALPVLLAQLPEQMRGPFEELMAATRDPSTPSGQAFLARDGESVLDHLDTLMNSPRGRAAEVGSGGGTATARSLARMYAMLAAGGRLDGVRIVSEASVGAFSTQQAAELDVILGLPGSWALGYTVNGPGGTRFGPSPRAFGHAGAGGQIGFCDPQRRVSVAYVRSALTMFPVFSTKLIAAVFDRV